MAAPRKRKTVDPASTAPKSKKTKLTTSRSNAQQNRTVKGPLRAPAGKSAFELLPVEIFCMVVHELPTAGDVANLSRVSKKVHNHFSDDERRLWCQYLKRVFEVTTPEPTAKKYERHSQMYRFLVQGKIFKDDDFRGPWSDVRTLTALRLLLTGAASAQSVNFRTMMLAAKKLGLFTNLFFKKQKTMRFSNRSQFIGPLVLTMLHVGFDPWSADLCPVVYSFDDSKTAAYHHPFIYPLFIQQTPLRRDFTHDMRPHATNLLLIANFFRKYLQGQYMCLDYVGLTDLFMSLPEHLRPQPWDHRLNSSADPLSGSTYWKGCTPWMDETAIKAWRLRGGTTNDNKFILEDDNFDEDLLSDREFFDLRLDFLDVDSGERFWPHMLNLEAPLCVEATREARIDPVGYGTKKSAANTPIIGMLRGREIERLSGNVHKLAETSGIQGFKRVSFVTFPTSASNLDEKTSDVLDEVNETNQMPEWIYEGVIMPGGNIMVGRWWRCESLPGTPAAFFSVASPRMHGSKDIPELPLSLREMEKEEEWDFWKQQARTSCFNTGPFMYWRVRRDPMTMGAEKVKGDGSEATNSG